MYNLDNASEILIVKDRCTDDDQFEGQLKIFDVETDQWKIALENMWFDNEVQKNKVLGVF